MNRIQEVFILNLKSARHRRGMSQIELANTCEISQGFLADIEGGKKFPSLNTLEKLCNVLEMRPFEFFLGPEDLAQLEGTRAVVENLEQLRGSLDSEISRAVERLGGNTEKDLPE